MKQPKTAAFCPDSGFSARMQSCPLLTIRSGESVYIPFNKLLGDHPAVALKQAIAVREVGQARSHKLDPLSPKSGCFLTNRVLLMASARILFENLLYASLATWPNARSNCFYEKHSAIFRIGRWRCVRLLYLGVLGDSVRTRNAHRFELYGES